MNLPALRTEWRYALRQCLKTPGLSALAVLVLSGGLALCLYVTGFLNGLLWQPLPIVEGHLFAGLYAHNEGRNLMPDAHQYAALKERVTPYFQVTASHSRLVLLESEATSAGYSACFASRNLLALTGVAPALGRGLRDSDYLPAAEKVAVLGNRIWRDFFASDPTLVGKTVAIDGEPVKVVGIMPSGFGYPVSDKLWLPMPQSWLNQPRCGKIFLNVQVKLRPGWRLQTANRVLRAQGQLPHSCEPSGETVFHAVPLQTAQMRGAGPILGLLGLLTGCIFLMTIINNANLVMVRVRMRTRELAVRMALGASRRRLWLQMLWEHFFLCGFSGLVAIFLAGWALDATEWLMQNYFAKYLTFWWHWQFGWLEAAAAIVFLVVLLFFAAGFPVWRATAGDVNTILKSNARGVLSGGLNRLMRILLSIQVGVISAVVFFGIATLFFIQKMGQLGEGWPYERVLAAQISLPPAVAEKADAKMRFYQKFTAALAEEPHFDGLLWCNGLPGVGSAQRWFRLKPGVAAVAAHHMPVSGGFAEFLNYPLMAGRDLLEAPGNENDSVVNQELAHHLWPGENPIGKLLCEEEGGTDNTCLRVVGVVADVSPVFAFSTQAVKGTVYSLLSPRDQGQMQLLVRYAYSREQAQKLLHRKLWDIQPEAFMSQIADWRAEVENKHHFLRITVWVFVFCGAFALILAGTGIFGLVAGSIYLRRGETGLRRALGARDKVIVRAFLRWGSLQAALGLVSGLTLGALATYTLSLVLPFGGPVFSWITVIALAVLGITIWLAIVWPARAAVTEEPQAALRHDG